MQSRGSHESGHVCNVYKTAVNRKPHCGLEMKTNTTRIAVAVSKVKTKTANLRFWFWFSAVFAVLAAV
jgi:hypothetical protein